MQPIIDLFLNLDVFLTRAVADYGLWIYAIFFVIVFAETGLVVMPFLPGDSLLFAAGGIAARQPEHLNVWLVAAVLVVAAILGDGANYVAGTHFRAHFLQRRKIRFVKQAHLERTHVFFEKYGGKAIVMARFVPIVRTVAPFFAGLGSMSYRRFAMYNVLSAVLWVSVCLGAGYAFGNFPIVKKNLSVVVLAIIFVSVIPLVIEWFMHRRGQTTTRVASASPTDSTSR